MNKSDLLAILLIILATAASAQTPKYKLQGNTVTAVSQSKVDNHDSTTTYKFTDNNGNSYPMYISKSGSYYIWVKSKKGILYKRYIKFEK